MTSILTTIAIAYLVLLCALFVFQRHLLYHPSHEVPQQSRAGVPEMVTHHISAEDGVRLAVWYAPPAAGRPVLVFFHGNAGTIGDRGFKVRPFLDEGYGVLLAGYRGFSGNPGKPTEQGLYKDARAAIQFLPDQGVANKHLVLYGESLGSGIAVQMAVELADKGTAVGAVVLEAPYSSIPDVAAAQYPFVPVRLLVWDRFDSASKIDRIGAPLLVLHGDSDPTIPIRFGRRLFAAAAEPKEAQWIAGARHTDLADFGLFQRVDGFASRHLNVLAGKHREQGSVL
jgi:fermentation-respiration switch protein FrsA (DUF1100 family)